MFYIGHFLFCQVLDVGLCVRPMAMVVATTCSIKIHLREESLRGSFHDPVIL